MVSAKLKHMYVWKALQAPTSGSLCNHMVTYVRVVENLRLDKFCILPPYAKRVHDVIFGLDILGFSLNFTSYVVEAVHASCCIFFQLT